jgi:hypothetical protein
MTAITSSQILKEGITQVDGTREIIEEHLVSDGRIFQNTYFASENTDTSLVLSLRATKYNELLAQEDEATAIVYGIEIPLSKVDIMKRITPSEWQAFQTSTDTTVMYFRDVFANTTQVHRTDPLTLTCFNYLEQAGILASGRTSEILV